MAKYEKQISLGYDQDGKRIRKWVRADTKAEFDRRMKELLRSEDIGYSNITVKEYADKWLDVYKAHVEAATRADYVKCLKKLEPIYGRRMKDVKRIDLQEILNRYWDRPVWCRHIYTVIRMLFQTAMDDGLIPVFSLNLKRPKIIKQEKRALTEYEVKCFHAADLDEMQRLFVDIEFYLGLRPEETRALCRSDFDWKNNFVTISKAHVLVGTGYEIKGTKTGKSRKLPMPDILAEEIRKYLAANPSFYLFVNKDGDLFSRMQTQYFNDKIFKKINEALGGNNDIDARNGWTMYTFRHNRATQLYYLNGISNKKKAEYMGHSEEMFLRTYSHLDDSKEDVEILRGNPPKTEPSFGDNLVTG